MSTFYKSLLFVAFAFSLGSISFAQNNNGHLFLQVINENGQPLEFVNFRLFSLNDSSVVVGGFSDENGKIDIQDIKYGEFYGILSFFGFDDKAIHKINISSKKHKINLGKVTLKTFKDQLLEEVVVMGRERVFMESSIDKKVYNVDEDMTSIGGDLTDVLNNIPSVEVDNDGNVSLRGDGSVTILIDGRESVLSSGEGALNGIPASAIERIEVVTNPSAKYNPEGTAGIINIVLKKQKLRGFNANVQLTAASQHLYNGSIGLNVRKEKVNFFANYSFRYFESASNNFVDRTSHYNDTLEWLSQERLGNSLERSHTGNIGADFFIKENQVLGISLSGTHTNRDRGGNQLNELSYNDNLDRYWNRKIHDPRTRRSIDFNVDYKLNFKDENGSLTFNATESLGTAGTIGVYEEDFYNPDGTAIPNSYTFQNQERDRLNSKFTFNTDLTRSINSKMKYETGIEVKINRLDQKEYLEFYDPISQEVLPDEDASNQLIYDEKIFSGYGVFGHEVTKMFKYQAGLRLEQAFIDPSFISTNESFSYKYFNLFPSLHLSLGDKDLGTFFASYSRRINRPSIRNLNPFPHYDDPLNLRIGNPELLPEYINSFELGYDKSWKKGSLNGTLYFKETIGKIQGVQYYREDGASVRTFANIDNSYDYGIELITTYNPFSWWRNMISVNAYESRVSTSYEGVQLNNKGITWDLKVNTTFSLFKNTTNIQLTGQYRAPKYMVQGTYQFMPGFDIGITRSLLNRDLVIGLKVSDIFNQKGFTIITNVNGTEQVNKYRWTSRRLYFTLSYKFGNLKLKESQTRPTFEGGGDMMD